MKASSEELIGRLPHQPPMRMVSEVIEASRDRARCRIRIDDTFCELWGDGESAELFSGIEMVAQTAAIAIGCEDDPGVAQSGMLVQTRRFERFRETVPKGVDLICEAKVDLGLEGSFALARGVVELDGTVVCEAQISLAIATGSEKGS